ncbi:MAG: DNA polymerase/3'-5' exonuclease PolX [Candidatus Tectimicrobiota bacterium]|nr:MAG: DNA polymerase/3'-5' exonuclease PolX [Candidatus Tectomicrobia bacterium]
MTTAQRELSNRDIAQVLLEMAALYEMEEVPFKPRAYERAAMAIAALDEPLAQRYAQGGLAALTALPGVGKSIAEHLKELLETGTFREYERLKRKVPVNLGELLAIEGVGPKMVKALWQQLGIRDLADLERAARAGQIRHLPHFGVKTEEKILRGIELLRSAQGRRLLGEVLPEARQLEATLRAFPEVEVAMVAGSVRRMRETVGDLDFLVISSQPQAVMERFVRLPVVQHVYSKGETRTSVRLHSGLDADLRVVPAASFGAALSYFTGSKAHNIALRELAIKQGYKLNEYGLFKGERRVAGASEEELYAALGLAFIPPELREDSGEIEAAQRHALPQLIDYHDLRGDLQVQTNWTDGAHSIEEMVEAAMAAGLEYIAITDHTKSLAMTRGADEDKLRRQMEAIAALNAKLRQAGKRFTVLSGAEVNINRDGSLDIDDAVLAELDVVGAAVHSHFNLPRAEQTRRVLRAMENPHVDILFHPTGRLIHRRPPIDLDIEAVIEAAQRTGTVLEINAMPDRLDLRDEYIRKCVAAGVRMAIDSDAHAVEHFRYLALGIGQARRGWAERRHIVNAWPLAQMRKMLKSA